MMDLRRLSRLVAVADERHFARAAERVHLSQPAFSRSIQALERDVGQRLFDRDAGEVRPTPVGSFLIERARRLLFDARCLQRDAELYAQSNFGDAALGAGPFPAVTLLLQLRAVARETDMVMGATRVAVAADLAAGRLVELAVPGLPPLFADMGVVSLRNRSPSPLARQAIQLISEAAARVNAADGRSAPRQRGGRAAAALTKKS